MRRLQKHLRFGEEEDVVAAWPELLGVRDAWLWRQGGGKGGKGASAPHIDVATPRASPLPPGRVRAWTMRERVGGAPVAAVVGEVAGEGCVTLTSCPHTPWRVGDLAAWRMLPRSSAPRISPHGRSLRWSRTSPRCGAHVLMCIGGGRGAPEGVHPVEHQRYNAVRLLLVHRAVLGHLHEQVDVEAALQVGAVRGELLQPSSQLEAERPDPLAVGRGKVARRASPRRASRASRRGSGGGSRPRRACASAPRLPSPS